MLRVDIECRLGVTTGRQIFPSQGRVDRHLVVWGSQVAAGIGLRAQDATGVAPSAQTWLDAHHREEHRALASFLAFGERLPRCERTFQ